MAKSPAKNSSLQRVAKTGATSSRSIARKRREEIVAAATEIIAAEGLHRLSLARIEARTGMKRGQLTYYFSTKEAILLAVFDRMLATMIADAIVDAQRNGMAYGPGMAWVKLKHAFNNLGEPHIDPDGQLFALVHTFLAQIRHRPDYRTRLAASNADWRGFLAADLAASLPQSTIPASVIASVIMALFQGLTEQLAVDPNAFDRKAVIHACLTMLAPFFGQLQSQSTGE